MLAIASRVDARAKTAHIAGPLVLAECALPRSRAKLVLSSTLAYERFLVAEDDPIIAMDLQDVLEDEGAMVFPASSVTQALRLAQTPALSAAVIDIKLRTENAEPVCDALSQRQVPFIFYTACPDSASNRLSAAPLLIKPAPDSVIIGALKYALSANKHDILSPLAEPGGDPSLIAIDQRIVDGEERIARISSPPGGRLRHERRRSASCDDDRITQCYARSPTPLGIRKVENTNEFFREHLRAPAS